MASDETRSKSAIPLSTSDEGYEDLESLIPECSITHDCFPLKLNLESAGFERTHTVSATNNIFDRIRNTIDRAEALCAEVYSQQAYFVFFDEADQGKW